MAVIHADKMLTQRMLQGEKQAFDEFFGAIPDGNLEQSTLSAMHIHERHLLKVVGAGFVLPELTVETLQNYVNRRCKHKTR